MLHGDETPVALLDPGAVKTKRAYVSAYARSHHDPTPGVVYDFCLGRGAQYPLAFLAGDERMGQRRWAGTLLTDRYIAYDTVLDARVYPDRRAAACVANARRKFDELAEAGVSPLAEEAIRRFARINEIEGGLSGLRDYDRQAVRNDLAKPLWDKLRAWVEQERRLVADGGPTAGAIDYTLDHWAALTRHLEDGPSTTTTSSARSSPGPWGLRRGCLWAVRSPAARRDGDEPAAVGQTTRARPLGLPA